MKKNIALLWMSVGLILTMALLAACGQDATPTSSVSGQTTATVTGAANVSGTTSSTTLATTVANTPTATLAAQAAHATQTVALASAATKGSSAAVTSGSGSGSGPTVTPGPKGGVTMKEAYALVAPKIKDWSGDAVLTTIAIDQDDPVGLLSDGRAGSWVFTAVSASKLKQANWTIKTPPGSKPSVSDPFVNDLDQERVTEQVNAALPPVSSLIDSNKLMEIARQNGGDKSDVPVGFELHKPAKQTDPLAFNLVFQNGQQVTPLRIDAQTGKLLENVKG